MTTVRNTGREDLSCVLHPGDHSKIKFDSYIAYKFAEELNYIKLLDEKFKGRIAFKKDIDVSVLIKIQAGAKASPLLKGYFCKFFPLF